MEMSGIQKSAIEYLRNDFELVQAFMGEHITQGNPKTAKWIYSQIADKLSKPLTEAQFQQSLSVNTRCGNIVGFEGRRRVGYVLAGTGLGAARMTIEADEESSVENSSDESEVLDKMVMQVTKNVRIADLDKHNFRMQVLTNGSWKTCGFYPTMTDAVVGTAKFLLNSRIRDQEGIKPLADMVSLLKDIQKNLVDEIGQLKMEPISSVEEAVEDELSDEEVVAAE